MLHYKMYSIVFIITAMIELLFNKSMDYAIISAVLAVYCLELEILSKKER